MKRAARAPALILALVFGCRPPVAHLTPANAPPPAASQNPSPMIDSTRAHERLVRRELGGVTRSFAGPAGKRVALWIPQRAANHDTVDIVVHFLGAEWLPEQAVDQAAPGAAAVVLNLGAGSGIYDRSFRNPAAFHSHLDGVEHEIAGARGGPVTLGRVTLTAFSAGHGAVRAILRDPRHFARVGAVLLLDGMHTSYVPDRTVLADSGTLDTTNLVAFAEFARAAQRGEKRFLVTHSEIFPGTFASTTETADWLLRTLGLHRTPVLKWGPRGMQQLSEVRSGRFELQGFAGNSAPDHVDQLHAMPELLARLLAP
jgi:hypothetical protein